jgi:hypothetical protein
MHASCFSYDYQNGKEELDKLLKFLDLQLDDKLKCDIIDMCGFEKMQNDKGKDKMADAFFRKDFKFYRKGIFIIIIDICIAIYLSIEIVVVYTNVLFGGGGGGGG